LRVRAAGRRQESGLHPRRAAAGEQLSATLNGKLSMPNILFTVSPRVHAEDTRVGSPFQFVADHQHAFEVERMCELVELNHSSSCAWEADAPGRKARASADAELAEKIRAVHAQDVLPFAYNSSQPRSVPRTMPRTSATRRTVAPDVDLYMLDSACPRTGVRARLLQPPTPLRLARGRPSVSAYGPAPDRGRSRNHAPRSERRSHGHPEGLPQRTSISHRRHRASSPRQAPAGDPRQSPGSATAP
jgi:hypothetical protein